jgi:endo-1,4-beta-xylanase
MKKNIIFLSVLLGLFFYSCTESQKSTEPEVVAEPKPLSLHEAYAPYFMIGTAINLNQINGEDVKGLELINQHFNVLTPENIMKSEEIHPEKGVYVFGPADKLVDKAEKDNQNIVGHALVWHSQLSQWIKEIKDPSELESVIKTHIDSVMGRYAGRIYAWDVVNEALNEDGTLRESEFYNVLGGEYLKIAYKRASEVDPDCKLYYNDYNLVNKAKREGAIRLIKELQEAGIKIDGVGMQGHWNLQWPSLEEIENSIIQYSELGIDVMITELDITVLPNPWDLDGADVNQNFEGSPFMNPYPDAIPDSVNQALTKRYEDIFNVFLKHSDKISRVSFWGVQDGDSWLNGWPIKDRTNYPLIFDRNHQPKEAFDAIINLAIEKQKQ